MKTISLYPEECINNEKIPNKYHIFFRPAKYLIPAALFAAVLAGGCDPEVPPVDDGNGDGSDDGDGTTVIDPATVIGNPAFNTPVAVNITGLSVSNYYIFHPALADFDADGDLDLLIGYNKWLSSSSFNQSIKYLKNTSSAGAVPSFTPDEISLTGFPSKNTWGGMNIHGGMITAAGNIDNDSDLDIIASNNVYSNSNSYGSLFISKNNAGSFSNFGGGSYSKKHMAPAIADLDGDGDLDLILGISNTVSTYSVARGIYSVSSYPNKRIIYQLNDGSGNFSDPVSPVLVTPSIISSVNQFPIPTMVDIDDDGDQDMFVVMYDSGAVTFYLNTGTASVPVFEAQASAFNVLPTDGVKYFPAFGDMDGDTDMDIIAGTDDGRLLFIENTDIE